MDFRFIDEIPQNVFTNFQEIGSGTFSDIFSAVHLNTNSKVALKISLKNNNEEDMKSFEQEISINKAINHPFICKYFTDIETDHLKIIVLELVEGVNALNYVNQTCGLPFQEALNLFTQLIIAIEYLHNEVHATHRDLKLENIMIDKYDHIRLIDFGFSSVNTMMTTCCGSIPYCAPEILTGQKYTKAADIWSLGIILYAFINGNLPFYNPNINTLAAMICNKEVQFTSNFPNLEIQDLIQRMLTKDPIQRITIDEIKMHPSISNQKLFQINYKQLFESNINDTISLSSQKLASNKSNRSKSSACFKLESGIQHLPIIKEPSSSNEATCSHHNSKLRILSECTSELDESIRNRKDFALNLNKTIESALLNCYSYNNRNLGSPVSMNLGSRIGALRFSFTKRKTKHLVLKNGTPLVQPNVNNNHKLMTKNLFDKK